MTRLFLALPLLLAACGQPASDAPSANVAAPEAAVPRDAAPPAPAPAAPAPASPEGPVLSPRGYDAIRIGAKPGAIAGYALASPDNAGDECRIFRSDRAPGLLVMAEKGVITRLSAYGGQDGAAAIRTDRGIHVGSTEAEVRAAYAPLAESPHKYEGPPAKDLVWGGQGAAPGLRFEIGGDGRVSRLHAGAAPALQYVEGCS
jgi:hypothetical protein